jgi:hypothetical protein
VERLVWYAAYGSNLSAARFGCYLTGGRPDPGATRDYTGARDASPPRAARPLRLPHRLYFTGTSSVWGGATAFLEPARGTPTTWGRAYLVTWAQFEDVVAQESHRTSAPIAIGDVELHAGRSVTMGPGRYETMLCVGRHAGVPVVTFTAPWTLADVDPGPPVPAYLAMLVAGLRETHQLDDAQIRSYLTGAPGCTSALVEAAFALLQSRTSGVGPAAPSAGAAPSAEGSPSAAELPLA